MRATAKNLPGDEVLRLRVVADYGRGRLLGLVLPFGLFADGHADAIRLQELGDLGVVLEVGAGGIAPRVPSAAVLLAEQAGERGPVLGREAPLLADAVVPVLGQG